MRFKSLAQNGRRPFKRVGARFFCLFSQVRQEAFSNWLLYRSA